ncbi:hypothetical protein B0T10DRAFT_472810 [Thelonectria olida]|uniref:Uncharacterized protein n=1 Tax=Thelonectria olida TaxID=1576542 RepID=A0A9P8WFE9_9HYPO|nr:hypothetical protein B0T10DRAFT_472810 [Thelonectria olida]
MILLETSLAPFSLELALGQRDRDGDLTPQQLDVLATKLYPIPGINLDTCTIEKRDDSHVRIEKIKTPPNAID